MESEDVVTQVDSSIITALREAVKDCGDRGLQFASKWSVMNLSCTDVRTHLDFIDQGGRTACIRPSQETV